MNEFIAKEKEKVGRRAESLRKLLHLSQAQVAHAAGISKNTLIAIEKGASFTSDTLLPLVYFYGMSFTEFTRFEENPTEKELRGHLLGFHSKNKKIQTLLTQNPTLVDLIKKTIDETSFFEEPRPVQAFREFLKYEYDVEHSSSIISQALMNAVNNNLLQKKKGIGRNYVYRSKRKSKNK